MSTLFLFSSMALFYRGRQVKGNWVNSDFKINFKGLRLLNRVTPELRKFWVFPANPGVQINFYSYNVVLLHKLIGHFIMFGGALWSCNGKSLFVPPD